MSTTVVRRKGYCQPPGVLLRLGEVEQGNAKAVVWACTSASFIGGLEWAQTQSATLASRLGMPITSTALAFQEALAVLGHTCSAPIRTR